MGEYAEDAIRRMHGHGPANDYARSQGRAPYWPDRRRAERTREVTLPSVRRRRMARVFGARYAGECAICLEGWGAGDPIWYTLQDGEEVLAHADCGKEAGGRGDIGFRPRSRRAVEAGEGDDRPAVLAGPLLGRAEVSEGGGTVRAEQSPDLAAQALERLRAARRGDGRAVVEGPSPVAPGVQGMAANVSEMDEVLFE